MKGRRAEGRDAELREEEEEDDDGSPVWPLAFRTKFLGFGPRFLGP